LSKTKKNFIVLAKKVAKYFGGSEKVRTFASAFSQKLVVSMKKRDL